MIIIDGSKVEGGGQVLRTALGLSLVTGQSFRIEKIRAKRKKPGLLRQHLTAVEAAKAIGVADAEGAELGSTSLKFKPKKVIPGNYTFSVGTAGSATLVLQTVLPALMLANGPSTLLLEGGTHNPMAPPFDFLERTLLPILNRMGPTVSVELERPGFYPAGGGKFRVDIQPVEKLKPLELLERGEIVNRGGRILISHLPDEIAERQARMLRNKLNWSKDEIVVQRVKNSHGPGNVVMAGIECENVTEIFTGFGERNVPSGKVVGDLVDQAREYLAGSAPVGEFLADQLMLPLALTGRGSYRAVKASLHARTNKTVIAKFLDKEIRIRDSDAGDVVFEAV